MEKQKTVETSEITLAMGRVYVLTELDNTRCCRVVIGVVVHAQRAKEWASKKPLARTWYECDVETDLQDVPELGSGDEPDANVPDSIHGWQIISRIR
jgi:hypothetical protein